MRQDLKTGDGVQVIKAHLIMHRHEEQTEVAQPVLKSDISSLEVVDFASPPVAENVKSWFSLMHSEMEVFCREVLW